MSNISDFKGQLIGGGARPNLFAVSMQFPPAVNFVDTVNAEFMIKAASLPSSVIGPIEVSYRGRKLKIAGDRTFENWSITVLNDTNMALRTAFESWMELITQNAQNVSTAVPTLDGYMCNLAVSQLDRAGNTTKSYAFIDAWPVNVQAIDLNYETNDAVEEFTVEFAYQYWVPA